MNDTQLQEINDKFDKALTEIQRKLEAKDAIITNQQQRIIALEAEIFQRDEDEFQASLDSSGKDPVND